jgi:hypothetical protein
LGRREDCRLGAADVLGLLGATVLTAAPWLIYCDTYYPQEFWFEHTQVWNHLGTNIENWAAPWDRVVFDYLIVLYGVFYTPVLVAGIILVGPALARRHTGLLLLYAWGLGVLLPHLVAVTKTPSATVIGMPPLFLLLGYLVTAAWRGERWPRAALTGVLIMSVAVPAVIQNPGYGYPFPREFGVIMRKSQWVLGHVAGALAIGGVLSWRRLAIGTGLLPYVLKGAALTVSLFVLLWLGYTTVEAAWGVTDENRSDPASVEVGQYARANLPPNAVLLCEERRGDEHLAIMFYADRTCYPLAYQSPATLARQVLQAGGIPYVVTYQRRPLVPPLHVCAGQGPTIYQWQPP